MRSTFFSSSAVTTSPSCSSRDLPFDGTASASRPRWRAAWSPGASARFEITIAIWVSCILPAAMLSAMATKLEPRPESKMPRFFITEYHDWNLDLHGKRGRNKWISLAEYDFAIAFDDPPDAVKFFSGTLQQCLCFLEFLGRDYDQHSEAHIKSPEHFFLGDIAEFLQMFKDGQNRPRAELNHGRRTFGQHSGQILGDAAAGNVRQRRNTVPRDHLPNHRPVATMGAHELIADFVLDLADKSFERIARGFKQQLAS